MHYKKPRKWNWAVKCHSVRKFIHQGVLQSIACLSTKSPSKYMSLYVWSISHFLYLIFNLRPVFLFLFFFSWFVPTFYIWLIFMSSAICYFFSCLVYCFFFLFMSCFILLCLVECLFFPSFYVGGISHFPFLSLAQCFFFCFKCLGHVTIPIPIFASSCFFFPLLSLTKNAALLRMFLFPFFMFRAYWLFLCQ